MGPVPSVRLETQLGWTESPGAVGRERARVCNAWATACHVPAVSRRVSALPPLPGCLLARVIYSRVRGDGVGAAVRGDAEAVRWRMLRELRIATHKYKCCVGGWIREAWGLDRMKLRQPKGVWKMAALSLARQGCPRINEIG